MGVRQKITVTLFFSLAVTIKHCGVLCFYDVIRLLEIVVVKLGSRVSDVSIFIRGPIMIRGNDRYSLSSLDDAKVADIF